MSSVIFTRGEKPLFPAVLTFKAFDSAFGIHDLLCAGVEGVASTANIYTNLGLGRYRLVSSPANAGRQNIFHIRMYFVFHNRSNYSPF